MTTAKMQRPYLQLQFLVLVLAFTAVLGRLITLSSPLLVMWRTGLAVVLMLLWLLISKRAPIRMNRSDVCKALGIGVILGLHWMAFFGSIQLSNISICLAGMASISFFTALSEPLINRCKPDRREILLGLMVIPGLSLVAGSTWDHALGLGTAIVAAMLAALFPVLNRKLTLRGIAPQTLTVYELIGASATCFVAACLIPDIRITQLPSISDWGWLLLLSGVCTVWAYSFHIHLLRKFTAFTTNLAFNFEPVYGILLAAVCFHEYEELTPTFYVGALFIIAASVIHAMTGKAKHPVTAAGEPPLD
ncbi:permease [Oceaniferula spumae]|uniref:Permease n=1 Tax=Oceaniferula spumae TaxID=2979115 RepID=A0AAT9FR10_9BACT